MFSKKRLTFQLTPLLDLLLIVIFAQYMEVQQTSAQSEREIARRAAEQTEAAMQAQAEADRRYNELKNQRQNLQSQLEDQLADLTLEMQRVLDQRQDLAQLVAKLFQIPKDVLEKALAGDGRTPQEREQIQQMVNELADEHRNDVIKHLLTHQAMRKRVDVWTLFITGEGIAELKVGDETKSFRVRDPLLPSEANRLAKLPARERFLATQQAESEAASHFSQELFNAYQTLPQPKSIVVLVVSWNENLTRYYREPVREGMELTLRLFNSSGDRTQFIPAVLGSELE